MATAAPEADPKRLGVTWMSQLRRRGQERAKRGGLVGQRMLDPQHRANKVDPGRRCPRN